MAMANHDYDGHRGKAMGNVESAVKLLDHSIMKKGTGNQKVLALEEEITSARAKFLAKHEGTVHEPQAISDMQMREAYVLIRDMTPGLAELKQPRVEEHVKKALEHGNWREPIPAVPVFPGCRIGGSGRLSWARLLRSRGARGPPGQTLARVSIADTIARAQDSPQFDGSSDDARTFPSDFEPRLRPPGSRRLRVVCFGNRSLRLRVADRFRVRRLDGTGLLRARNSRACRHREMNGGGGLMIIRKLWSAFRAQMNKAANFFWGADPIAQMQYEYDRVVDQLKDGRTGLEQYGALVERLNRQVTTNRNRVADIESRIKAYLTAGDRDRAGELALELQKARKELAENEAQLKMQQEGYNNNLLKIKQASKKVGELREKIQKYDADLKMSRAEAELSKIARDFNFDVTTNTGQIEEVIQDRIDRNRAAARVSVDLSGEGLEEVRRDQAAEKAMAENALREFEAQIGATPGGTSRPALTKQ
jgi:phage shock protein A